MPYFLCDEQLRHINEFEKDLYKYSEPPLSDFVCGAPACGGTLRSERYNCPPKSGVLYKPTRKVVVPAPQFSANGIGIVNASPPILLPHGNSGASAAIDLNFGLVAIRPEAQTQARMVEYYAKKGFKFLSREGQFTPYNPCQWPPKLASESVDEPGFVDGQHLKYNAYLVGRLEIGKDKAPFGHIQPAIVKGGTTYPDIVIEIAKVVYAIELKTPRIKTKDYMSEFYNGQKIYLEDGLKIARSVKEELEQRRANLPKNYESVILLDLFNTRESLEDAVEAVRNSIAFNSERKGWWENHVNGFMFCCNEKEGETVSRRFTIAEILSKATDLRSVQQQSNIMSFFGGTAASSNKKIDK